MISNKDIRIENGYIIINGEKYPIVQDVSEIETELSALSETVGDETNGLVKDVSDIDGRVTVLEGKVVKYTDVSLNASTTGHVAPSQSPAGVYYERLVNYETLGIAKDKILNIIPVNWDYLTKSFCIYMGDSAVGAMSDTNTSIYSNDPGATSYVTVRVLYTD